MTEMRRDSICTNCGIGFIREVLESDICDKCGGHIVHTEISNIEGFYIRQASRDVDFFLAMNDLKKNDIIAYQTKVAEFKTQYELQKAAKASAKPKCPKCGSTQTTTGSRGATGFWGFIGASKTVNRCGKCGFTWNPR